MHMMIADNARGILGSIGKLSIKVGTRIRLVDLMNVVYLQACRDYVDITMASGETLHTKEQITRFENELPGFLFARIHRSYIINTEYLQEIRARQNDYDLVLSTGTVITTGSVYRKQIRDRFITARESRLVVRDAVSTLDHAQPGARPIWGNSDPAEETLRIRTCSPGDEASLTLLGQATYIEAFTELHAWQDILEHCGRYHSPDFYRARLQDRKTRIWMVEGGAMDTPVGYLMLGPANPATSACGDDDMEIQRMYFLDRYRDSGADERLLAEALDHAQDGGCGQLWTIAYEKSDRQLEFFGRAGFSERGEHRARIGSSDYRDLVLGLKM